MKFPKGALGGKRARERHLGSTTETETSGVRLRSCAATVAPPVPPPMIRTRCLPPFSAGASAWEIWLPLYTTVAPAVATAAAAPASFLSIIAADAEMRPIKNGI